MSDVNIRVRILNKGTPNERKVWQLDYFDNNVDNDHPHGHRHQPHCDNRDEARKERKRIRREVEDAIHAAGDGPTIAELGKLYLHSASGKGSGHRRLITTRTSSACTSLVRSSTMAKGSAT